MLSTISTNEFYKIPQLYELENFEVHTSSEEALLDKWNQLWEQIQEIKSHKTVLESKLMNLTENDKRLEKVMIFIGKGNVAQPSTVKKYQVCLVQRLKSQLSENEVLPEDIESSVSVLIDNTVYPAVFQRNQTSLKKSDELRFIRPGKFMSMSTWHTLKVSKIVKQIL